MKAYRVCLLFHRKKDAVSWEPSFIVDDGNFNLESCNWGEIKEEHFPGKDGVNVEDIYLTMMTKDEASIPYAKKRLIIEFRRITEIHVSRLKRVLTEDADNLLDSISKNVEAKHD